MTKFTVTLSIALILFASCSTIEPSDFSILRSPSYDPNSPAEAYADQIVLLAPELESLAPSVEPDIEIEPTGPLSDPVEEIPQPSLDEVVEAILEPSEEIPDPVTLESFPEPSTDITLPPPSSTVRIGANELPMWFCYTSAGLFLASLFTICYIAKQRKESAWHRFRD